MRTSSKRTGGRARATATSHGLLLFLLASPCSEGSGSSDGGAADATGADAQPGDGAASDARVRTACEPAPLPTAPELAGHPAPLQAQEGEARIGRIERLDALDDPTGLSTIEPGDFVLANADVAVVIEAPGPSDLYDPWGGKLVGLGRVEAGRLHLADFNEVIYGLGTYTFEADGAVIVEDGEGGAPVRLRVTGRPRPLPFLDGLLGGLFPVDYSTLELAVDYALEPGARSVEITYHLRNGTRASKEVSIPLHLFLQDSRMPAFVEGRGFDIPDEASVPYVGFAGDGSPGWAWESLDGPFELAVDEGGALALASRSYRVDLCETVERPIARVHIGGSDVDGLQRVVRRARDDELRELRGSVLRDDGSPAEGVRVHAESADGERYLGRDRTDDQGRFALEVDDERPVRLFAYEDGTGLTDPVAEQAEGLTQLTIPVPGTLHVRARDAGGQPVPARIHVTSMAGRRRVPSHFGEPRRLGDRLHAAFPLDGEAMLPVPPGNHRVVVGRGPDYSLHIEERVVSAGETVDVDAVIRREVQSPGQLCGDFHVHTHRSPDSPDPVALKIRAAVADGVEILLRSDHEYVADFEPAIAELGATDRTFGIPSLELTTFVWGHMGVFPLPPDPALRNRGAFSWFQRSPPEVFADVRQHPGSPAVIINHPRGRRFAAYFDAVGYDATTGTIERPEWWDESFRLVEVFNDSSFDENRDESVQDWFSLLEGGRDVFAVGSSDSHDVRPSSPVGYPRTCLALGLDSPAALRADGGGDAVRDAALAGASTIQGGVFVTAETVRSGLGPGNTLAGAAATELVRVRVQAPCWVDVDELEAWVDGSLRETVPLAPVDPNGCNPLRLDAEVLVPVREGRRSWAVFHARGDASLAPLYPRRLPFGVTNPIFFER